jgi:hypothetical protein
MLTFEEVLLPLSASLYPDYIYLRQGEHVQRVAKYDPWVIEKLLIEAGLPPPGAPTVPRALF